MKKNAFTLIELLGVIVLLGILGLLIVPTVDKILKDAKQDSYQTQLDTIMEGAKTWVTDYIQYMPETEGEMITIQLGQLKQAGKVETNIKNPITEELFPDDMLITVTYKSGQYFYEVIENSGTENNVATTNPNAPSLIMNGPVLQYVALGGSYTEKSAVALDSKGDQLSNIDTQYKKGKEIVSAIDTSNPGTYSVTYLVTDHGLTTSVVRTVIVKDMTPPTLTIPADTILSTSITSYDLKAGVSATDNVAGDVKIVVSGNLSLKIPGKYLITYTATDKSGNQISKTRVITITD